MKQSTPQSAEAPTTDDSTFTHHTAAVNDVRLHYVRAGKGDPVVLLHGWPQTLAENVRGGVIESCAHWIAEERPDYLIPELLKFFGEEK